MNESIGDFRDLSGGGARVSLVFYPGDFAVRWSQCSATADFFAEYFATVQACRYEDESARSEFIGTISYIVNELVENAVKFSVARPSRSRWWSRTTSCSPWSPIRSSPPPSTP